MKELQAYLKNSKNSPKHFDIEETLNLLFLATNCLTSLNKKENDIATKFLQQLSLKQNYLFDNKSKKVKLLQIVSSRNKDDLKAIVYQAETTQNNVVIKIQEIAFFSNANDDSIKFSYKLNLDELKTKFCHSNDTSEPIRQIGDEVLARAAATIVDFNNDNKNIDLPPLNQTNII